MKDSLGMLEIEVYYNWSDQHQYGVVHATLHFQTCKKVKTMAKVWFSTLICSTFKALKV